MDLDEIEVKVIDRRETDKSYCLKYGEREALFPKAQVSFKRRNLKSGEAVAEIPTWLLKDRGWDGVKPVSPVDDMPDITPQDIAETQPPRIGWDL